MFGSKLCCMPPCNLCLIGHCQLMNMQGYEFYIAILYIVAAVLVVSLGLCIWVGWCFKNQRFTVVW